MTMTPRCQFGFCGFLLLLLQPWPLLAQSTGPVPTGGPIADYLDHAAFVKQLEAIDQQSARVTVSSLGTTSEDRPIHLLTISEGEPKDKPAILVLGNVEPGDLVGGEVALRVAQKLSEVDLAAESTAANAGLLQLLSSYTVFVIPRPSPDATAACFRAPFQVPLGNGRSSDDDRDHHTDEDPAEDLDGDGWITQIRVADPAGDWIPHPNDPRVMIKADPNKNERGRYHLFAEGYDNDQDEAWNEDGPGGVSFNRNFTFQYPNFQPGAGPHAVSEAETRTVADFVFDHPQIAVIFSFSPQDNLFHPWKPDPAKAGQRIKTVVVGDDAAPLEFLAKEYQRLHGGKDAPAALGGEGSFAHWAYFHAGRWSLSSRGWWPNKVEPPAATEGAPPRDERAADELNRLRWMESEKIDGFVPWTAVTVDNLPGRLVEVGGFKPFLTSNPPATELDGLAQKHVEFLARAAELMPRSTLRKTLIEPLGGGLALLTVTVANDGYLSTVSEMGRVARTMPPLQIELKLPADVELVTGHPRGRWERLKGTGTEVNRVWVLRNNSGQPQAITVDVSSPAVGSTAATVNLP